MTEEDIKAIVRAIKASQAEEFEALREEMGGLRRELLGLREDIASLHRRINEVEMAFLNSIRDLSRRIARLESAA